MNSLVLIGLKGASGYSYTLVEMDMNMNLVSDQDPIAWFDILITDKLNRQTITV